MAGITTPPDAVPRAVLVAVLLAVFAVSIGFGVMLPLLPYLIERLLGAGVVAAQVSRHTGMLTAVYTVAIFLFAPYWGRLADRLGPRRVLLVGLLGFAVTMLVFAFVESLVAIYVERFLSGMFAAAVSPVATAVVGAFSTTPQRRARCLAFVSMASIVGFLLGPMLGVAINQFAAATFAFAQPVGSIVAPLAAAAVFALLVSVAVLFSVPDRPDEDRPTPGTENNVNGAARLVPKLLLLTFLVSFGIGAFEVGLALRGKDELALSPYQIALMFSECSLIMLVTQAIVFSPWFRADRTRWLISPALAVLAVGLLSVPLAFDFKSMLVLVGAVSTAAGVLSPILTFWISTNAGSAQGWHLGRQSAAASLGVTLGSAAGGLLSNIQFLPGGSFVLAGVLAVLGFVSSLGVSHLFVPARGAARN